MGTRTTRNVMEGDPVIDVLLEGSRKLIFAHIVIVRIRSVIIGAVRSGSPGKFGMIRISMVARQAQGGQAAVRLVTLINVQEVQMQPGIRSQTKRNGRSNAPMLVPYLVTARHMTVFSDKV